VSVSLELKTSGLSQPTSVTHAADGSGRLFITEQSGRIKIYSNGSLGPTLLDIAARVRSPQSGGGNEEGLLSMAFPPGFGTVRQYFYVYYTNLNGDNQVSRFSMTSNPNQADPASEKVILHLPHPNQGNHNGGQLVFGPDGYLYIGTGDGGGSNDPYENAQDPSSLLGKILRIDVEMQPANFGTNTSYVYLPILSQGGPGKPLPNYLIPEDNPFVNTPGYRGEIWALGLRNPWRFSFDRSTQDVYIGDVGQGLREEIDYQSASSNGGENYGWPLMEGNQCHLDPTCTPSDYNLPIIDYQHINGNCSVTGGYAYRGTAYPALQGIYIYADYCSAAIWGIQYSGGVWENQTLGQGDASITSFGEDEGGELYLLYRSGSLMQVTASGN
jgi:glucose/arabinose dehydrogenase